MESGAPFNADRDRLAVGGRREEAGVMLPMMWGWNIDAEYVNEGLP